MPNAPSGSNRGGERRRRIGLYGGKEKEMSCAFMFVQFKRIFNHNTDDERK
jgi:hypothetical protein